MRIKYNAVYENTYITESSYIRRYLGTEIETLLNPEANSIHDVDFESFYVNIPVAENYLAPLKTHMDNDRCVFLTGLTGCGKSSVLTHTFHADLSNKIRIENEALYILFTFDHAIAIRTPKELKTYFINMIKHVSEIIKEKLDAEGLITTDESFFSFIRQIRGDDLQYAVGTVHDRLTALSEADPIDFCTLQLKYYLFVYGKINHVVLIVDDVESVGYKMELVPIELGLTFWSCLKRQPQKAPRTWSSGLVISCRHYVYRMIETQAVEAHYTVNSGIDGQTLESYPINDEINIPDSVRLIDIIKKRVEVLSSLRSEKRWNDAWAVVEHILVKTDDKFGDFISAICINNIRKSLTVLKQVVLNKRWIQRTWKEETPGAFTIDNINDFNLSPPCLLRAISLGEGHIYTEKSIIPNILCNTMDIMSDFITLIALKAFLKRSSDRAISWRISIDRDVVTGGLKEILPTETHSYIDDAIKFLIMRRLLLRSKNQSQDDGLDINPENINSIKYVYVSKGAFTLWNQMARSSVLLELYSDDIYIDYQEDIRERQNFALLDLATFERCITLLVDMVKIESDFRITAHNHGLSTRVDDVIGSDFIVKHLLSGLKQSRNAYFKTSDIYGDELDEIEKSINKMQRQLRSRGM